MDLTPLASAVAVTAPPAPRVALLVDGENLSAALAPRLVARAGALGPVTLRRAYGKPAHLGDWESHGFRLIPAGTAKNAADLALCVDAMTLALREGFSTLVIASSDRDFSPLALQLRELGFTVIGMGDEKTPQSLRRACSDFVVVDAPVDAAVDTPEARPAATPAKPTKPRHEAKPTVTDQIDRAALSIWRSLSAEGRPVRLSTVGQLLAQQGLTAASVGKAKWSTYFKGHPGFRLSLDGQTCFLCPA